MNVQRPPTNIPLGRQGENLATCIIFDCTGLAQLYGDGTAELLHELKDGTIYPVAVTQDGASVSWTVSASDTATIGSGRAELRWYVGDTLAKSAKFRTSVSSALADSTTETPPEPQKSWVDKVLAAAQEIKDGAISDEQLAAAIAAYLEEHPIDAGLDEAALAAYLTENGYLTDAALADAIAQALADAKASGQFDGAPGKDGADGGYYTPNVDNDGNLTWTASADNMPAVTGANIKGPQGNKGETGATGEQGPAGADGQPGADGVTPNIQIGTVDTLTAGSDATASITGTAENPLLNLGIPKGADGTSGKSAYQYAQEGGYTGTEEEFAVKMAQEIPIVDDTLKIPGQAADAAVVGEQLGNLSEEKADKIDLIDKSKLSLGVGSDGLLYVYYNGTACGVGVAISGGIPSGGSDGSGLVVVFTADFTGDTPLSTQFYAWEGRVYDNAIYDSLQNIQCIDGVLHLTSVYDSVNSRWIKQMMCTSGLFEADNFTCAFKAKFSSLAGSWQNVITYGTGTHWTNDTYSDGIKWPAGGEIDAFEQAGGYSETPTSFSPGVHYGAGSQENYPNTHLAVDSGGRTTLPVDEWAEFKFSLQNGIANYYLNDKLIATQDLGAYTVDNNYLCNYNPFLKPQAFYIDGSCVSGSANGHTDYKYNFEVSDFKIYQDANVQCTGLEIYPQMWDKETELVFPVGAELYLDRVYTPANTSNKACKWESSDTSVATVCQGYVTCKSAGTTTITATCGNVSATYELAVSTTGSIPCAKLILDTESVSVAEGNEVLVTSYIYPKFTTDTISWNSTNESIATVSNGCITGVNCGNCQIIATCGAQSVSLPITVNEAWKPIVSYDFTILNDALWEVATDDNKPATVSNTGIGGNVYDLVVNTYVSYYDTNGENYNPTGYISRYSLVSNTFDGIVIKTTPFAIVWKGLDWTNRDPGLSLQVNAFINGNDNGNVMPSIAINSARTDWEIGYGKATKYSYPVGATATNIVVYSDGSTVYVYADGALITSGTTYDYMAESITKFAFGGIAKSFAGFELYVGEKFSEKKLIEMSTYVI